VSSITDATQISAGGWHTCALTHSNGAVKCWGYNGYGQLGNGSTLDSSTPVEVSSITDAAPVQVSAGGRHTCALLSDGTVECWGNGEYGQLGNGSTLDSSTPVEVSGITNATQISAGEAHTCALLSVGTVKCWGDNGDGELGNGATDDSSFPVEVSGITNAVQISAGGLHTCALLSGGTVKCWGGNGDGELGNGSTLDSSIPVNVVGFS
jgi:alpha-tubulin suppressor-like RCC1 family protein